MKGKINLYFEAPNISKVKSRVADAPKEFSQDMRTAIQEAVSEEINASILSIRGRLIQKFQAKGYTVKDPKHAAALANTLNSFFDVVTSTSPIASAEGDEDLEPAEPNQAPADDFQE